MKSELIFDAEIHDAPEIMLSRALSDAELSDFEARFPDAFYDEDEDGDAYWISVESLLAAAPLHDWLGALPE